MKTKCLSVAIALILLLAIPLASCATETSIAQQKAPTEENAIPNDPVHLQADTLSVSEVRVLNDKDQVVAIIGVNEDGSGYISILDANGQVLGGIDASRGLWWLPPGSSSEEEMEEEEEEEIVNLCKYCGVDLDLFFEAFGEQHKCEEGPLD